jgi:DNA invertase Pin-like site-specific DNA recombinase
MTAIRPPTFTHILGSTSGSRSAADLHASPLFRRRRLEQDGLGHSVQEVRALGIGLYLHQQGLDSSTPAGTAMFQMLGVFAEFERALIRERVMAGLNRAQSQGKVLGRPRMPAQKTQAIRSALEAGGQSLRRIDADHRVGLGTVQRMKASMPG